MQTVENDPEINLFSNKVPDKASRRNLAINELMKNLIKLAKQACSLMNCQTEQEDIIGKPFEHTIIRDSHPLVYIGTIISQVHPCSSVSAGTFKPVWLLFRLFD